VGDGNDLGTLPLGARHAINIEVGHGAGAISHTTAPDRFRPQGDAQGHVPTTQNPVCILSQKGA